MIVFWCVVFGILVALTAWCGADAMRWWKTEARDVATYVGWWVRDQWRNLARTPLPEPAPQPSHVRLVEDPRKPLEVGEAIRAAALSIAERNDIPYDVALQVVTGELLNPIIEPWEIDR